MDIAQKLRKTREKLNLTREQAAQTWEVNVRTLQAWEQGERKPKGLALKQLEGILADALKNAGGAGKRRGKGAKGGTV